MVKERIKVVKTADLVYNLMLMKNLLKYLKPYTKESILAPAFKLVEALLDLVVPLVIADIVNTGVKTHDWHYIIVRFIFLILLGL